jgi:hypothetical protein
MSFRQWSPALAFVGVLLLVGPALAAPPAPELVAPAEGDMVVTPTFEWYPVEGAERCQVQVADNDAFAGLLWEAETHNSRITPVNALPNGTLWWRVRCQDATRQNGPWSEAATFTKEIPAPDPITPFEGDTIVTPGFAWYAVEGATSYWVEVAADGAFTEVVWEDRTHNTNVTPADTLPNGRLWWRVRGRDAEDHDGTLSVTSAFTKEIPAPAPIMPAEGDTIVIPTFRWYPVEGATYYWVEVAADSAFTDLLWADRTYDPALTPARTLPNGRLWWRVRGRDADDHDGTLSATSAFTKEIPAPEPITPVDGMTVDGPVLRWYAVEGAAYYWIEIATDRAFTNLVWENRTANTSVAPVEQLPQGALWWRVRGHDADDHDGTYSVTSSFTLARTGCDDAELALWGPDDGAETAADPEFEWTCQPGAAHYKVLVYRGTDLYDRATTEQSIYVPYAAPNVRRQTYANGTYTWKVEAYDQKNKLMATSDARRFTKAAVFDLYGPDDDLTLGDDPTFDWEPLLGAHRYKVEVYRGTQIYDGVWADYPTYTPYAAPNVKEETYANGPYTWKVEAYDRTNTLITTSSGRWRFTKAAAFDLYGPDNGLTLGRDPTFDWQPLSGAHRYKLEVHEGTKRYDSVWATYPTYTPYEAPNVSEQTYANGTYTWKVEAYDRSNTLITTSSDRWRFAKAAAFDLYTPEDGLTLSRDPSFTWSPLLGAHRYRLLVYKGVDIYDQITTVYPDYTPYRAPNVRKPTYDPGSYTWVVEAYDRTNTLIATSDRQAFGKGR